MSLESFDHIFRDVARAEARICQVPTGKLGVPHGKYLLREYYCNLAACDCRRVVVQWLDFEDDSNGAVATVNYGWERAGYYRKWSRDAERWRKMAGVSLEPETVQGPYARGFLELFNRLVKDHKLVAVFRRHYRMVKERAEVQRDKTQKLIDEIYTGERRCCGG
jgi:hypothetical protein